MVHAGHFADTPLFNNQADRSCRRVLQDTSCDRLSVVATPFRSSTTLFGYRGSKSLGVGKR